MREDHGADEAEAAGHGGGDEVGGGGDEGGGEEEGAEGGFVEGELAGEEVGEPGQGSEARGEGVEGEEDAEFENDGFGFGGEIGEEVLEDGGCFLRFGWWRVLGVAVKERLCLVFGTGDDWRRFLFFAAVREEQG